MKWKTTTDFAEITQYLGDYIIIQRIFDYDKFRFYYKYKIVSEKQWLKFQARNKGKIG